LSIGYVNICSSVQDHRQKFSVFKCIGSEEQIRTMKSTKWKLVLQESILIKRGSEADVIRSTLIRSWTSEAEVIRGSEGSEAEDWKLQKIVQVLLLSRLQKNMSLEQRLIQRNWKALDAYSLENIEKGH